MVSDPSKKRRRRCNKAADGGQECRSYLTSRIMLAVTFPLPAWQKKTQPTNNYGYGSVVYMTSLNSNRHFKVNKKENDFLIWKQNSPKWWWRPTSMMLDMAPWRRLYKCFIWHKRVEFVFLFLKNEKKKTHLKSSYAVALFLLTGRSHAMALMYTYRNSSCSWRIGLSIVPPPN